MIHACLNPVSARAATRTWSDSVRDAALFPAIRSGSTDALSELLAKGANANAAMQGVSALMAAALSGTTEQMKLLIDRGANVNYKDGNGTTVLWLSVPSWDRTTLLLDHGADPQLTNRHGYTVLTKLAFIPGTVKLFQLLIDHGADPKKSGPDNLLLYNAASSNDTAVLGLLLRCGLSVNDTVSGGDVPLNSALCFRCFASVKMLVDHGADPNIAPMHSFLDLMNGITPLMNAAVNNDKPSLLYLLDHGADPSAKSKKGYTPLIYLEQAEDDDPVMTQALIDHGANAAQKAPDGTDALYYARKRGNTKSVAILLKNINK